MQETRHQLHQFWGWGKTLMKSWTQISQLELREGGKMLLQLSHVSSMEMRHQLSSKRVYIDGEEGCQSTQDGHISTSIEKRAILWHFILVLHHLACFAVNSLF